MSESSNISEPVAVSVLIPAYNMGQFVSEAISSVIEGSFSDVEILVIDDGSTDDTRLEVAAFLSEEHHLFDSRVRYIHKTNGGKPSALNEGLRHARGAFITVLDADDQLPPDSLTMRYNRVHTRQERPELIIGGFEVFDEDQTLGTREQPTVRDPRLLKHRFYTSFKTPFHFNACLVSRDLIDRVGPFDVALVRCQDIDYAMRCLHHTNSIAFADAIVYRYRKHRSSIRERIRFRWKTALHRPRVMWKNFEGPQRVLMVLCGIGLDAAKMAYELAGNYKR